MLKFIMAHSTIYQSSPVIFVRKGPRVGCTIMFYKILNRFRFGQIMKNNCCHNMTYVVHDVVEIGLCSVFCLVLLKNR